MSVSVIVFSDYPGAVVSSGKILKMDYRDIGQCLFSCITYFLIALELIC